MKPAPMKRFSPALLLLLNGCFSCGTVSHVQPVEDNLKIYRPAVPPLSDRHGSASLKDVKPGDWVRYQAARNGNEITFTVGAVRVEGDSLWIEVVEEGDPKKVSLRRVGFDGTVLSARYQELPASGPASEVTDQPLSSAPDPEVRRPASVEEGLQKLTVGTREVPSAVVKQVFRDEAVGREYRIEEGWSKEVPALHESWEGEGLVYRTSPTESVRLLDWGTGYTPALR